MDEERAELRKSVSSLNAQLEQTINDKNEVSRHFWNLTEDTKSLKEELESSKEAVQSLTAKQVESEQQSNALREMSAAREKSLVAELEQVRSTIDQAVLQASKQKEIEMRNEFKDMLERMGGMQEQAEMTKDELSNLESERNQLIQQLNKQKSTTENVTQQLRDERQKSDGAALEIATLQQNIEGLRKANENSKRTIEDAQDEQSKQLEEVGKLKADLQIAKKQREEDAQMVAVAMSERDGIMNRYKSDVEQNRQTVESLRKSEQNAGRQVQELAAIVENLKNENRQLNLAVQNGQSDKDVEIQNYKNVLDQLQKELETRLEQLTGETERADANAREASAIRNEVKQKAEELQEREKSWSRSYTKEKERLQSEYATLKMQNSNLEQEKSELLSETQHMTHEMKELRKEMEESLDKNREQEKLISDQERQVQKVKQEKIELLEELKQVNRREEETQINNAKREENLMSEMDDCKAQLKSTKKQAAGQVMEFQSQTESLMKQIMKLQGELAGTQSQLSEKQRSLDEFEVGNGELKSRMEEVQAGYMNELNGARREIERFKGSALLAAQEARKLQEELDSTKIELARVGGDTRTLRDGKREAEGRARDAERQLRHLEEDLAKASDDCARYRGKSVELEDEVGKLQLTLREVQILNVDLKEKGNKEAATLKIELEKLNDIVRSQEESLEGSRRLVNEHQTKYTQLQSTSNATINGLMAELKATEEALVRERERMSHDTEVLRAQVVDTERDMDSNISKYKTTITALREESDRYRRAAYTLEAENNKQKVQLEGKKRELDRLAAEMEVAKDANRDSERRLAQQKDAVRAAQRELERMREGQREFEEKKGASDHQLSAANAALKGHMVSKDEEINKLKLRLKWTEEENAAQVSVLNKEKNDLMHELGLQPAGAGAGGGGGGGGETPRSRPGSG